MILSNGVPNPIWDTAMGQGGVRFPPGSWDRGGGYAGFQQYGLKAETTGDVQADVLEAMSLAISELKAQGYVRFDLPKEVRDGALLLISQAEQAWKNLALRQGDLSAWLDEADLTAAQLTAAAQSLGDNSTGAWLNDVISGGRSVTDSSGFPFWAIGLGLAAAAFVGYKILKK